MVTILFIVIISAMLWYVFAPKTLSQKPDEVVCVTHNNITVEIEGLEIVFSCKIGDTPLVLRVIEIYTESLQIIYKSKNIDTVISRVSVCKKNCATLKNTYGFVEQSTTMIDIVEAMSRECYIKLIDVKIISALAKLEKAKTDKGRYGALLYFTGWLQKYQDNIPEDIVENMTKKLMSQI